jgi:outer membrane lipoprotein
MKKLLILPLLAFLFLSGCAHVISEAARNQVDQSITFGKLRGNPEAFIGKNAMLGGIVVVAKNTKEGGQLEIVQFKLDELGFPIESSNSGGRFLATTPDFIDAMVYSPRRMVTIVGEVKGKKVLPLDEVDYTYPVISIKEIYAWKVQESERGFPYPAPGSYNNYDPYYYGYDVPPYWYRPSGPVFRPW